MSKKILILVLSADFPPYNTMIETSLNTWDSVDIPNIETIFYCGKSHKPNTDKIIYLNVDEYLLNLGNKCIGAFEWALQFKDFDYVARVHSSIYVDKKRLTEYIETLPSENLMCGVEAKSQNGFSYLWGGLGYIISKDVVQKIADNKKKWRHNFMEDESLSLIARDLNIPFHNGYAGAIDMLKEGWQCISYGGESISFTDFADLRKLNHHYYRIKQDGARHMDEYLMNKLFETL